jgi:fructokinase
MKETLYGCIEAGGTKFVCAVGSSPDTMSEAVVIPTTDPATTLKNVIAYFREAGSPCAFGIASFGPADVDPNSPRWGTILATPKPGWSNVDIRGTIAGAFGVPAGFDTDVNGAVLAEARWGAAADVAVAAYVTVGTGIGAGVSVSGNAIHGKRHTEAGHFFPRRHPADLEFSGWCPFHADCFEGLASGPAIERRWGKPLSQLPQDHVAHEVIGFYLGQLAVALIATTAADAVIFGGGVLKTPGLLERIRTAAVKLNAGYLANDDDIPGMIREPALGTKAGLLGALLLAQRAAPQA